MRTSWQTHSWRRPPLRPITISVCPGGSCWCVDTGAGTSWREAFAEALHERDPHATPQQLAQAREKAFRAPTLLLAFTRAGLPGDESAPGRAPGVRRLRDPERAIDGDCAGLRLGAYQRQGPAVGGRCANFSRWAPANRRCLLPEHRHSVPSPASSVPHVRAKLRDRTRSATMSQPVTIRSLSRPAGASFAQPFEMLEATTGMGPHRRHARSRAIGNVDEKPAAAGAGHRPLANEPGIQRRRGVEHVGQRGPCPAA